MGGNLIFDGLFQVFDTPKSTAANALVGDFGKPSFHLIEPRGMGGSKVEVVTRSFGQPARDERRLMRGVIIQDEMNLKIGWNLTVDVIE